MMKKNPLYRVIALMIAAMMIIEMPYSVAAEAMTGADGRKAETDYEQNGEDGQQTYGEDIDEEDLPYEETEPGEATDGSDDFGSDGECETSDDEELKQDVSAAQDGSNENTASIEALSLNDMLYVPFGESLDVALPYEADATFIKFDCEEDGFYSLCGDRLWQYYGFEFIVYGENAAGEIDLSNVLYNNGQSYDIYNQNPWYSNSCQAVRMSAGHSYYCLIRNTDASRETITKTFTLQRCDVSFTVTNNSKSGTGTREFALFLSSTTERYGFVLGYTIGKPENLLTEHLNYYGGIELSLAPGESAEVSVLLNDDSINWRLTPKYDSDYTITLEGDTSGLWESDGGVSSFKMGAVYTPDDNAGSTVTFHSISDYSEIRSGNHYIFAVKDGDDYYALACDDNRFITKVALSNAELTNADGEPYDGYTMEVSTKDIKYSDYVMTSTKTVTADSASSKFKSNCVDPISGSKLSLKMGRYGGDYSDRMFDTGSGDIYFYNNDGAYYVRHSTYGQLNFYRPSDGKPQFTWKRYYAVNDKIIILTDSEPQKTEEPVGEQLFYRISAYYLPSVPNKNLLIVYHADDGTHYALTAAGAVPIENPSSEDFTGYYEQSVPTIRADAANAWMTVSNGLTYGFYGYDYTISCRGLKQGDMYFYPDGSRDKSNPYPFGSETKNQIEFLTVKDAIISFDSYQYNPDRKDYSKAPCIGFGTTYLKWDSSAKTFIEAESADDAAHFELYEMLPGYAWDTYSEIYDLSKIADWSKILITYECEDGTQKVLTSGSDFSLKFEDIAEGNEETAPCYAPDDGTLVAQSMCGLTPGKVISTSKSNYKIGALTWKDVNRSLYIDGYPKNGVMLSESEKESMFTYTADGSGIILRGAKNWFHYDETTGQISAVANKDEATPIHVWTVEPDKDNMIDVVYHTPDGQILSQLKTSRKVELIQLQDMTNEGNEYIFVGWTTDESKTRFLDLDDSCNLYDYDDMAKTGVIKPEAAEKLGVLGNCTPEVTDTIDPREHIAEDGMVHLYPVFARKSFDSVVTADNGDVRIVGISDWKDLETIRPTPGHDPDEGWLGKIYCNVYKDGELWVDTEPMYFCYHNDDAADINIKFIDDTLLDNYKEFADPLFAYMSDGSAYPKTAQEGNYVIDAVYASQGGSEDGLKYQYNWISGNGGRLDNVEGGSTINVYITTLYQVEYFLDDVELTGEAWQDARYYATPGTDDAFSAKAENADYFVTMDNDYHALMDHTITDDTRFTDDKMLRGDYSEFAYYMKDYEHTIPIALLPAAPAGRTLSDSTWAMKDQRGEVLEIVEPGSNYGVTGVVYGTGNTVNTWMDDADDSVNTYHLYVYTTQNPTTENKDDTPVRGNVIVSSGIKTGESSPVTLLAVIMIVAGAAAVALILRKRRC